MIVAKNYFGFFMTDIGILGLSAIVLSSPYDISMYVTNALVLLCDHPQSPDLAKVI